MIYVTKATNNTTVDFAAEELKKYIRMMDPDEDVVITEGNIGFRLGLMSDFCLDTSDCKDTELDDVIYLDCESDGGIIAGSNPRSVLIAVYELLRRNGCRFLFPGLDGEYIPEGKLKAVKLRHKPSLRYRGPCLEGSIMQEALLDMIDFLPKVGMNMFQYQFFSPIFFYRRHYCHWSSEVRSNEHITERTVSRLIAMSECEMKKRGIEYHAIGHGWTVKPFGIDVSSAWAPMDDYVVPEDVVKYLAELDGKRGLYGNVPTNTQFCMSNPEARKIITRGVVDYAEKHSYVNCIDFWLADAENNHCECEECMRKSASDWMVITLNEIDEALTAKGLKTKIAFAAYTDTLWAPLTEKINNPDRFILVFAPISRSYTRTLGDTPHFMKYVKNKTVMPPDLASNLVYLGKWLEGYTGPTVCFEYYFWLHQYFDTSIVKLAERAFEDIECYAEHGLMGLIGCGSQRSFFPNGFTYYVFARKQYDMSLTYEEIRDDYFKHAYGDLADEVYNALLALDGVFGQGFMEGEETLDKDISEYYNPARAEKLAGISTATDNIREIVKRAGNPEERLEVLSFRMLREYAYIMDKLAPVIAIKARGENERAIEAFEKMRGELSAREIYFERQYDFGYFIEAMRRIIKGRQRDDAFGA